MGYGLKTAFEVKTAQAPSDKYNPNKNSDLADNISNYNQPQNNLAATWQAPKLVQLKTVFQPYEGEEILVT